MPNAAKNQYGANAVSSSAPGAVILPGCSGDIIF
jgi:hypothetical protein